MFSLCQYESAQTTDLTYILKNLPTVSVWSFFQESLFVALIFWITFMGKIHLSRNMLKLRLLQLFLRRHYRIRICLLFLNFFLVLNLAFDLRGETLRPVFVMIFFVSFLYLNLFAIFKQGRHYYFNIMLLAVHFLHERYVQIK